MTTNERAHGGYDCAYDPATDLLLERVLDVSPALVWRAWTTPELVKKWFTPRPWSTSQCEIDLRPGGVFRTVLRSPEGEEIPNVGCFLEIDAPRRIVWTIALLPGYRPAATTIHDLVFTAITTIEPHARGTKYTARVMHPTAAAAKRHADMGFTDGWGAALTQLEELAKTL